MHKNIAIKSNWWSECLTNWSDGNRACHPLRLAAGQQTARTPFDWLHNNFVGSNVVTTLDAISLTHGYDLRINISVIVATGNAVYRLHSIVL